MRVSIGFDGLSDRDLREAERLLTSIRRALADCAPALEAIRALLTALDVQHSHGRRRRGATTIRLMSGQGDPAEEELARSRLIATLQAGRDAGWLSPALRAWLNELLVGLVEARRSAVDEADTIRRLYTAPSSRNPREAA